MTRSERITLAPAQARVLAALAKLPPYERAAAARRLIEATLDWQGALGDVRRGAALELRARGLKWAEVGDLLGIGPQAAHDLANGYQRRHRRHGSRPPV